MGLKAGQESMGMELFEVSKRWQFGASFEDEKEGEFTAMKSRPDH